MVAKTRHSAQLRVSLQALAARLKATLPRKPTNSGGLARDNLMARVDRWSVKGRYCTDPKTGWLNKNWLVVPEILQNTTSKPTTTYCTLQGFADAAGCGWFTFNVFGKKS